MNRLLRVSQVIALSYPLLIAQMVLNNYVYPVSALFGTWYCAAVVNTLDPFVRGFFHFHSLAVALLRYLCINHDGVVRKVGLEVSPG